MSLMCASESCKLKSGMCGHEKLMGLMALAAAVFFLVRHFA